MRIHRIALSAALFSVLLLVPRLALAHAVLVSSAPAADAVVHGPRVSFDLRYNSRLDARRSTIRLVSADGKMQLLDPDSHSTPTSLHAHATLNPGHYRLLWQALSTDGHITRGEIPFTVQ